MVVLFIGGWRCRFDCSHADDASRLSRTTSQYYAPWSAGLRPTAIMSASRLHQPLQQLQQMLWDYY